jgi:hypothetical protein
LHIRNLGGKSVSGKSGSKASSDMQRQDKPLRGGSKFPRPEEGHRLVSAFLRIEDAVTRQALITLAEALVQARPA